MTDPPPIRRPLTPPADTPAARLQRLRLEARAIAAADMEALIADLGLRLAGRRIRGFRCHEATICAEVAGSDAYPVGARRRARQLADDPPPPPLPKRLLRLQAIGGRSHA